MTDQVRSKDRGEKPARSKNEANRTVWERLKTLICADPVLKQTGSGAVNKLRTVYVTRPLADLITLLRVDILQVILNRSGVWILFGLEFAATRQEVVTLEVGITDKGVRIALSDPRLADLADVDW